MEGGFESAAFKRVVAELRGLVADWLRVNRGWPVGDAVLEDFLEPIHASWEEYCDYIEGDTNWGDHLSLVALCNLFGVKVVILGSQKESPVTVLEPAKARTRATEHDHILLSHWHERHYNSLVALRRSV
jgi:hypothetical protein